MQDLDVAIDEYLHTIVRSQPWIKKHEADLLLAFSEWLYAQPLSRALTSIRPELTARYVAATSVSEADHEALNRALQHVFAWAEYQHEVPGNPFLAATSA
jgi:hypothetical protein